MQYLVVAKMIYGVPFAIEAEGADEALQGVVRGQVDAGPPFVLSSLPVTQWSVEPLVFIDALTKMYNALHGVVSMFGSGLSGVDFEDERVAAIYTALANAEDVILTSRAIQKELDERTADDTVSDKSSN